MRETGPLLWGPLLEEMGRLRSFSVDLLSIAFQIPVPLARNVATLPVFPLLSGMAESAAISISPRIVVDMLAPKDSCISVALFMKCTLTGQLLAPIAGSYLVFHRGWRWTGWITLAISGACNFFALCAVPELYHDTIKQRLADSVKSCRR